MQLNFGFDQLILDLRSVSQSKSDQGSKFEQLMKKYFLTSPLYSEIYDEVWLWNEFPYANTHDIGIDLVAKLRNKDDFCAIQCKFYKEPLSNPTQLAESNSITTYQFIEESSVLFRNVALFELFANLNIYLELT